MPVKADAALRSPPRRTRGSNGSRRGFSAICPRAFPSYANSAGRLLLKKKRRATRAPPLFAAFRHLCDTTVPSDGSMSAAQ